MENHSLEADKEENNPQFDDEEIVYDEEDIKEYYLPVLENALWWGTHSALSAGN